MHLPASLYCEVHLGISRQLILLLFEVCDYAVSAQAMILLIDILHNLAVANGIVPLLRIPPVPLIESITQ